VYREHFGLTLKPFSITPDPKFLYMSPQHKEALAHLLYGLKEGTGFVVITGEVGTGKTTILNAFLLKLPPRMPKVVIKNPHIRPENLYYLLGEAIGLPEEHRSRDHLVEFEDRLKATGGAVLICDEAQGLSYEMLEEIRLLSNLETVHEKLVQIMLLGQQELNEKLGSPQLRQLKQRIGVKYHITPLDSAETRDYIDHRLRVAGYEPREEPLFTPSAMGEIYRYTRGFPRLINIVCDNVLLAAYSEDMHQVSAALVKKVVSNMEKTYVRHSPGIPARHIRKDGFAPGRAWLVAAAVAFIAVLLAVSAAVVTPVGKTLLARISSWYSPALDLTPRGPAPSMPAQAGRESMQGAGSSGTGETFDPENKAVSTAPDALPEHATVGRETPGAPSVGSAAPKSVVVAPGDTMAKIAARHYGRVDAAILRRLARANPAIRDINVVFEGQTVFLPDMSVSRGELFTVSVSAYQDLEEATRVFLDLVKGGYSAAIYTARDERGDAWYRLVIGTFTSAGKAQEYASKLKTRGFPFARVMALGVEE